MLNLLSIDIVTTGKSMNQVEDYLNENEVPFEVLVDIDDRDSTEIHITAGDIHKDCDIKSELTLICDTSKVDKYIIYSTS